MKCPICGLDFFLGKCAHNTITLLEEIERLKEENTHLKIQIHKNGLVMTEFTGFDYPEDEE